MILFFTGGLKMNNRKADFDIHDVFLRRWSPRAFSEKEVTDDVLHSIFEAARWAPSAANIQPWQFIYAKSEEDRERFLTFINDNNVKWCQHAPVLVAVASKVTRNDAGDPNPTHAFDTGAAWGYLALEATRKGLITHGMGGFSREKAKEVLNIPDDHEVHAIIAIGYQGTLERLDESFHEREKASDRKKLSEFISEGQFTK